MKTINNISKKQDKKQGKKRVEDSSDEDYDSEDSYYETVSEDESSGSEEEIEASSESEYKEGESENEETSDEEKVKTRSKSKRNKKRIIESDEEDDDDDEEEEEGELEKSFVKMFKEKAVELSKKDKKNKKGSDDLESVFVKMLKKKANEVADKEEKNIKNKKNKKSKKDKKAKSSKKNESEDEDSNEDDDEDYDEEDYDDYENALAGPGIILSIDGFGIRNDEDDYEQMKKEDKNEKCDSDDEQTFMKESYKHIETPPISPTSDKKKKKSKKNKSKKKDDEESDNNVEDKYAEFVKLREELSSQLKKTPKNKILQNAIKECRKSIGDLVKKEREKNTEKYFKLVHKDPKDKKDTNEMSYFKKKLSHKEQMRVMKDLKEINALTNTDKPYRLALLESDIPPKFKAIALQKLNVLKSMQPSDSEYYKMKNWVDGFMRIPYGIYKNLSVSLDDGVDECHKFIENARNTLDSCTYGLNDAKMQILQMVGQWISNPGAMGTAIAIKGPPGTGKTTLVKEGISKILGREFAFIALGGTSDASFLEGHSYTYEGSTWGKVVSILQDCKCMNPVIYFDELDKISETPKGEEIAGILTHLTDTTQNSQFHDKYFSEVDFDLSKCLFIFSYNDESKVNPILKDRMYRIQTKGYEGKEKVIIARKHLLPKIREQVNFKEEDVIIPDKTLDHIISHKDFCKGEQGVRNLKRCLEIIHTKLNLFRLVKSDTKMFEKEMKIDVKFPFTVEKEHVDIFIKNDDPMSQSMLAMYV
jgi:ATP-dependent Lon protease